MGEGDPLRMAGLPVQPKKPGSLSKSPRNKANKRQKELKKRDALYRYWAGEQGVDW
jgi:hypothetical protein